MFTTDQFCVDTNAAFNKVSYYTNAWWNNISKTVLIFKIGPEMTKLDLIWYIKIFTTKRIAILTHVIWVNSTFNESLFVCWIVTIEEEKCRFTYYLLILCLYTPSMKIKAFVITRYVWRYKTKYSLHKLQ